MHSGRGKTPEEPGFPGSPGKIILYITIREQVYHILQTPKKFYLGTLHFYPGNLHFWKK